MLVYTYIHTTHYTVYRHTDARVCICRGREEEEEEEEERERERERETGKAERE